ncbi:unnamed protein product [Heterosigma akashiwo]
MKSLVFLCWAAFCCAYVGAFIPNNGNDAKVCSPFKTNLGRHSKSKLRMSLVLEPASTLLAEKEVIDVLTDEVFGPIFLGGIGIMVATVVAAFAVGKLIELSGEEALFADELSGKSRSSSC